MVNWAISAVELGCGSAAEKTVTHTTAVTLSRQGELRHFRAEEKDKWLDDALLFSREREKVTMVVNIELSDNAMFIVALWLTKKKHAYTHFQMADDVHLGCFLTNWHVRDRASWQLSLVWIQNSVKERAHILTHSKQDTIWLFVDHWWWHYILIWSSFPIEQTFPILSCCSLIIWIISFVQHVCAIVLLWLRYLYTGTGVSVAQKADVVEERESETQPGPTFSIVFSQGYVNLHLFDI